MFISLFISQNSEEDSGAGEDDVDSGGIERGPSPNRKRTREGSPGNSVRGRGRASRGKAMRGRSNRGRGRASRGRGRASRGRGRASWGRASWGRASVGRDQGNVEEDDDTGCGTSGKEKPKIGFDVPDASVNPNPVFAPHRPPGIHVEGPLLRGSMTTELEFFRLFLTSQMISAIVAHTNTYAHLKVGARGYNKILCK